VSGFARPLRGHLVLLDGVLAAALYVVMMLIAAHTPQNSRWHLTGGLAALAVVSCGASLVRRRRPVLALVLAAAPIAVCPLIGVNHGVLPLAVIIPLINVFSRVERRTAMLVAASCVVTITGAVVAAAMEHRVYSESTPPGFSVLVLGVVCIAIGEARRSRRDYVREVEERARRAEHGREQEARRRVAEERVRISRDLHDILAHHIALITVQAGAAAHVLDKQPELAREALAHIREAGAQALSDLHETITVLRADEDGGEQPAEPTAGLERLDDLIDGFTQVGVEVVTEIRGPRRRLPATADVAVYRVIQESLTNVRKHAGPVRARVLLDYQPRQISVQVENPAGALMTAAAAGTGHGLLGMRERALTLGGSLEAGPLPGGGFRVAATIPSAEPALGAGPA
jgi:signal transduction histidine kinase